MMIYQEGTNLAFAVADLYGQTFAVGEDFRPEDYHPELHYGTNYLLAVGDSMTEMHFDCPQLKGITDVQLLSVLVDHVTRRAVAAEAPPFADLLKLRRAETKLREAMEALEGIDGYSSKAQCYARKAKRRGGSAPADSASGVVYGSRRVGKNHGNP